MELIICRLSTLVWSLKLDAVYTGSARLRLSRRSVLLESDNISYRRGGRAHDSAARDAPGATWGRRLHSGVELASTRLNGVYGRQAAPAAAATAAAEIRTAAAHSNLFLIGARSASAKQPSRSLVERRHRTLPSTQHQHQHQHHTR